MQIALRKLTSLAYTHPRSPILALRRMRMAEFLRRIDPRPGARILDLGGSPEIWRLLDRRFEVTLVNLPGGMDTLAGASTSRRGEHEVVYADACDLREVFSDGSFDVVFSNSVIEHVGDAVRRQAFAREVRRLAPAYWVQTPSPKFPIEPHTGFPFYFRLPPSARARLLAGWRERMPLYAEMVEGTTIVHQSEMRALFPDAAVYAERVFGFEKSYSFYRKARAGAATELREARLPMDARERYVQPVEEGRVPAPR